MRMWMAKLAGLLSLSFALVAGGCTSRPTVPATPVPPMWQTQVLSGERIGITFGTYNVNGLSNLPGLREDLCRLEFVDIWAMQEVRLSVPAAGPVTASQPASTQLESILPLGLWHVLYVPVNRESDDACEGQAIVSRWPIERAEVWPLEHSAPKSRVAVAAWIATPRGQVLFVNADHEVGGWGEWGWPRTSDRHKQVQALVAKLSQHRSTPVVLAGDFNTCGSVAECTSSEKEIRSLNASMTQVDLRPLGSDFERIATYTDLRGCYRKHVDHLFLSDRFAGEVWEVCRSDKGSDHYPVWCRAECDRQPPSGSR
jgi:endonuclease/exonuclease/phosphatase family metal-dependent hydrolase